MVDEPAAAISEKGGRLVRRARWLLLAGSHLTRRRFGSMARRIGGMTAASALREAMGAAKLCDQGGNGRTGVYGMH